MAMLKDPVAIANKLLEQRYFARQRDKALRESGQLPVHVRLNYRSKLTAPWASGSRPVSASTVDPRFDTDET